MLSSMEPVFPRRSTSRGQSYAVSRAIEFGNTRSSTPTLLVERFFRLEGNRNSNKFTAFRVHYPRQNEMKEVSASAYAI